MDTGKVETKKKFFTQGAIEPERIARSIAAHSLKKEIGAHSIFLGQVRQDAINGLFVEAIEFTSYAAMAEEMIGTIREAAIVKFQLTCAHVLHSIGKVEAGGICLYVFTSAPHRRAAIDACNEIVERIKKEIPVFGKEILSNGEYHWKKNTEP